MILHFLDLPVQEKIPTEMGVIQYYRSSTPIMKITDYR